MFITPYFGGCKYTNNFLFINKNIEFQWFGLLITHTYNHLSPPRKRDSGSDNETARQCFGNIRLGKNLKESSRISLPVLPDCTIYQIIHGIPARACKKNPEEHNHIDKR